MEFAEVEALLREFETVIQEIKERMDMLERALDTEIETLQLQINNLRD